MKRFYTSVSLILLLMLNGCGFSLRGDYALPTNITVVQLTSAQPHSALKRTLSQQLKPYNVQVLSAGDGKDDKAVNLFIIADSLDRRLLSLFPTGQVAEYELIYSVSYQLQFAGQDAELLNVEVRREYQDDPDAVLAKSRELELVLGEMREQAADRIIQQISVTNAKLVKLGISPG